jgi:hypothetical protein
LRDNFRIWKSISIEHSIWTWFFATHLLQVFYGER